ncbi:MAG TPA: hypothetical protein VNH46_06875 [Gemmatimonadales bacterium]|nr:hypothetical protein [Gemmatimonadales bacterium]
MPRSNRKPVASGRSGKKQGKKGQMLENLPPRKARAADANAVRGGATKSSTGGRFSLDIDG